MEDNVVNEETIETPISEETPTEQNTQLEKLKERIPYDETVFGSQETYEKVLLNLLEDAKYIALEEIYPFRDFYEMELPKKYLNWQLRACVEIYNLADKNGVISYSENGLSWTKDTGSLSKSLMGALTRRAGVPRNEDEEDV